ncbi:hypothetical protein J7443_19585 [Tropicibacter sp. R15_0]|uniref:hypothetical protein n=1 Tax=Tropicibacter sp. R15_0 TaxID=2821101 RepID=UPI001AD95713|nr:hypothetical protein [Tropicibacter sp. R15_0]MBO9467451.1 hypothetical protein [Tropicibacter sp. R15_0]
MPKRELDSDVAQFPTFKLFPEPADDAARASEGVKLADDTVGKRHQLGGQATYLQDAYVPNCPSCAEPMVFYGQLDSIDDNICLADAGLIHVWLCKACFETKSVLQSG